MAEPFKNLLGPDVIKAMAKHLANGSGAFDKACFLKVALKDLPNLELMQRSAQIERAMHEAYSCEFEDVVKALLVALHPEKNAAIGDMKMNADGIAGWPVMPMAGYVANYGFQHPQFSLAALREMTMRSSSEFAVRLFFRDHADGTLKESILWAKDKNVHVRRLASEGSRPRLPWGIRLQSFVDDPSPILPILEMLRDDPSEYVRRSVANNLNDIAKDHPDLVVKISECWLKDADVPRRRLVRHACRTLIKDGHAGALALFGVHPPNLRHCELRIDVHKINLGDTLGITLELQGGSNAQKLVIDYVMHYLRANGSISDKVFKWTELEISAGEFRSLVKKHAYRKVTTRKDYRGTQAVSVRINGKDFSRMEFELNV